MALRELAKIYDPASVEEKWYTKWETSGAFKPDMASSKETFTILIPPPNITGILTIGHVLNLTIQDVLVRRARMQGKNTLWLPGTDHASIATEARVSRMLKDQGTNKREIGREEFLKHAWEWKAKYGGTIVKQLRNLGASCDWDREVFTMDENYSRAVQEVFVRLYNDGLIYRGERIINWDPVGRTALSDEEVIYHEQQGKLWYFKYPLADGSGFIEVATTRPETMLGDTGIAVNPDDERYRNLVGKKVKLPIVGRDIPIFADDYVDREFGTGCVKVTPAHDPNDFEMGQRHGLEIINIFHPDASLNEHVPSKYQGLDRDAARLQVVAEFEALGLLSKIEDYTNKVGHSERTNAVVEPYLSKQWFVKMKPLAEPALKAVAEGRVAFFPDRWVKTYNHWLENIRDWCISRQLWWGHRIPVWYRGSEIYCGLEAPAGTGWQQEEDVLDTWFSSWLWPFATMGWPEETSDLKKFYPTQDLVTAPDIIFFWVARMIMASLYFKDDIPFERVYFTGIIRDEQGRKMSKSLGNSPDPLDLFREYGADATRVSILMIAPQGLDILFSKDQTGHGRNFMNKLWNSSRFVLMNLDEELPVPLSKITPDMLDLTDRWILTRLNETLRKVDRAYDLYRMNDAVKLVYDFVWADFCDWYIEFAKSRFYGDDPDDRRVAQTVSVHVLKQILKLLHPYTPFITEELWSYFKSPDEELLINSAWPQIDKTFTDTTVENTMKLVMDVITAIRNVRTQLNIAPGKPAALFIRGENALTGLIARQKEYLSRLAKVSDLQVGEDLPKPPHAATAVVRKMELFIPLEGLIDLQKEIERLKKQIAGMEGRLSGIDKKLSNANFISRAPAQVIEHERAKRIEYADNLQKLKENYSALID
ncbi:MAG: valine--tRNA ligase [FCB group bacterium]|nr:valine--tRNA ligase [FCB group bacterium]